ncbi:MAG: hypothetical protein NTY17_11875 [Planctomycetia bacterium]|nr:hypothetical protein [Planctomycetia bacterium]
MNDTAFLVQAILARSAGTAAAAWRQWRREVDVQKLSWSALHLLPVLGQQQLQPWLVGDPDAGILMGIVRRGWTEAQMRRQVLQECTAMFEAGGVGPVMVAGPSAVFLRNQRPGSVRPLTAIHLAVPRHQQAAAHQILQASGWLLEGTAPELKALDWVSHTNFLRNGIPLKLLWRHLSVAPWRARRCEADLFANAEPVMPAEHLMLSLLGTTNAGDSLIPWQVDAVLLPLTAHQWESFRELAACYAPAAFDRLAELRQAGMRVPAMRPHCRWTGRVESLVHGAARSLVTKAGRLRSPTLHRTSLPSAPPTAAHP